MTSTWPALAVVVAALGAAWFLLARRKEAAHSPAVLQWQRSAAAATKADFAFEIDEAFEIPWRGQQVVAITGQVKAGTAAVGDRVLVPVVAGGPPAEVRLLAIQMFQQELDVACPGDLLGLLVQGVDRAAVRSGAVITMGR